MSNQKKFDEIIESNSQIICVIAGPGSGKTKGILIPKIEKLLSDSSINTDHVILLTFSRASAQDLKQRFESKAKSPRIATLHSLCLSYLMSENNHDIRKRINSIILDFERDVLVADIKLQAPELYKRKIKKMLSEFSAGWATMPHDDVFTEDEEKRKFKRIIVNWLDEYEAAMMEEIVYNAVNLAKKIQSSFIDDPEYILVDEYQDLNALEQEFVDLLANKSKLLLVVGDPDQSIYSFKYAHPSGINEFSKRKMVEVHSLEFVGRSAKKIVNLANEILKQIEPGRPLLLKPLPDQIDGTVDILRFTTQDQEFEFVVRKIGEMIKDGIKPSDILVLLPKKKLGYEFSKYANNVKSNETYKYKVTSKIDLSPLEQERILLFGLSSNPRSLLHLRTYIGLGDDNYNSMGVTKIKERYGSLEDALQKANPDDFEQREHKAREGCVKLITIREFISTHSPDTSAQDLINELFPEEVEGLSDLRNLLFTLLDNEDTVGKLYSKFIDYMRTLRNSENEIRTMTLISSKGLEAEHVFIIGCNDGNIPGENRSVSLNDFDFKQEQRRLLYVGITRAKKSLTISWSQNIPFEQAMGNYTSGVGVRTINGKKYARVSMSEFLQDLSS